MKKITGFHLHQFIIQTARQTEKLFMVISKSLYEMKNRDVYKELGYESFNAYLHDNELPFPATMGHALVKTYEQLVLRGGVKEEVFA